MSVQSRRVRQSEPAGGKTGGREGGREARPAQRSPLPRKWRRLRSSAAFQAPSPAGAPAATARCYMRKPPPAVQTHVRHACPTRTAGMSPFIASSFVQCTLLPSYSPPHPPSLPTPVSPSPSSFGIATCAAGTGGDALVHQEEIARSERAKNPASLVAAEQQIPAPAQAAPGVPDRPACATWPLFPILTYVLKPPVASG